MSLHRRAVANALRASRDMGKLMDAYGSTSSPRGPVLSAYRAARAALADNLGNRSVVNGALGSLRAAVRAAAERSVVQAVRGGQSQAEIELQLYELGKTEKLPADIEAMVEAMLEPLDTQISQTRALIATGAQTGLVIGDSQRAGVLTPGPVLRDGARWIAAAWVGQFGAAVVATLDRENKQPEYGKQVIAAIDERTTDCCLRLNGQVVPFDKPFKVTGTPRFADEIEWAPFHWNCRSSVALVPLDEANDDLTKEMRTAGRDELKAREDGSRVEIDPADARSRR